MTPKILFHSLVKDLALPAWKTLEEGADKPAGSQAVSSIHC